MQQSITYQHHQDNRNSIVFCHVFDGSLPNIKIPSNLVLKKKATAVFKFKYSLI